MIRAGRRTALLLALAAGGLAACGGLARRADSGGALRISEMAAAGDATRRASTRLVLDGLDSEVEGQPRMALSQYERAIQLDATNPYAYLALARYYADRPDPDRTVSYLDQTTMLLNSQGGRSPRVEPHLVGLRGNALYYTGRYDEAQPLLARAHRLAPAVWADGRLAPAELR